MRLIHILIPLIISIALLSCRPEAVPVSPSSPGQTAAAASGAQPTATGGNTPLPPPATIAPAEEEAVVSPEETREIDEPSPTATPTSVPAAPVNAISLERSIGGFIKPLGVEHAGDRRLFVVQQAGIISVILDLDGGIVQETPFLDIVSQVNSSENEQGLLGLAFHPDYENNGRFYVNYIRQDGRTVISEFQVSEADPNVANPDSERVLLVIEQPFLNHNGGQIRFGPDGYLYIGMGDGGSQGDPFNVAQNPNQLLGSLLRIDVDNRGDAAYAIPADNPFIDRANARPEIWAIGLRNPWRFSFDRKTGDLFIADVGQNQWEEVNFQPAGSGGGENYGWRILEGTHCYTDDCNTPGLIPPISEYAHEGRHCSVTGGFIYRGSAFPELFGNYFFADYCSGTIWRLFQNEDGSWEQMIVGQAGFLVSSFGEDVNGELYLVNQVEGSIYRLTP